MMEERASDQGQNTLQPNVQLPVGREVVFVPKNARRNAEENGKAEPVGHLPEHAAKITSSRRHTSGLTPQRRTRS
jgi:hypothetical protein